MAESLADAYPKEQERVRTILGYYEEIGPVGAFGAAMIRDLLSRAEKAVAEQDTVEMIRCFKEMQEQKA